MYLTVTPKAVVLASWKCTVSKVISLKMKTLIFAVVCTYLMWGPHRENDTLGQLVVQVRGRWHCT